MGQEHKATPYSWTAKRIGAAVQRERVSGACHQRERQLGRNTEKRPMGHDVTLVCAA